jgi:hypothetical protein
MENEKHSAMMLELLSQNLREGKHPRNPLEWGMEKEGEKKPEEKQNWYMEWQVLKGSKSPGMFIEA